MQDLKKEIEWRVLNLQQSHEEIALVLQQRHPEKRGLSSRSVRRFCKLTGITRRDKVSNEELDSVITECVCQVGHQYGRKTMQGLLASRGVRVGEGRVGQSLKRVSPGAQAMRTCLARRLLNPVPYSAEYFGEKLHVDQNEKLIRYGVTHALAIDGFSRKVVGFLSLPQKNTVEICARLFLPLLLRTGLWDQVRSDGGREFDLMLFVQRALAHFRRNTEKPPYRRTQSIHNLRAERFWCNVNQRVNYPLKAALRYLEEQNVFDLSDDVHKFGVSWVALQVAHAGLLNLGMLIEYRAVLEGFQMCWRFVHLELRRTSQGMCPQSSVQLKCLLHKEVTSLQQVLMELIHLKVKKSYRRCANSCSTNIIALLISFQKLSTEGVTLCKRL